MHNRLTSSFPLFISLPSPRCAHVHPSAYVCRGGSAIFLFLQAVIILDAILAWNDSWAERDEQNW